MSNTIGKKVAAFVNEADGQEFALLGIRVLEHNLFVEITSDLRKISSEARQIAEQLDSEFIDGVKNICVCASEGDCDFYMKIKLNESVTKERFYEVAKQYGFC